MFQNNKAILVYPETVSLWGRGFSTPQGFPVKGSVQSTFFFNENVLQITPGLTEKMPTCFLSIISRWVVDADFFGISKINLLSKRLKQLSENLECEQLGFPSIVANLSHNLILNHTEYPCLVYKKINGESLDTFLKENYQESESIFLRLASFLTQLHSLDPAENVSNLSLRDYYVERFNFFKDCFGYINSSSKINLQEDRIITFIVDYFLDQINLLIDQDEKVCLVHGDFRPENSLIEKSTRVIKIIDFEQGLLGGDWLIDLWKLGILTYKLQIGREKINPELRKKAFEQYCKDNKTIGRHVINRIKESEFIEKRLELLRLDFFLSSYILRFLMNWDFFEKHVEETNQSFRGTHFILKLVDDMYNRIIQQQKA